jgi:peroxiredoxin
MPAARKKLVIGRRAPDFTLPSTGGKAIRLSDFRWKKQVVLAFYCLDWTPG